MKAVDKNGHPAALCGEVGHSATVDALLKAGADGTAKDSDGKSPADHALEERYPMIVAKCDPAFAKAEGEKLRAAFKGAKRVSVLSTRFNEPSKEVLAKWYKATASRRRRRCGYDDEEEECDTDDEDGEYTDDEAGFTRCNQSEGGGLGDKALPRGGQTALG